MYDPWQLDLFVPTMKLKYHSYHQTDLLFGRWKYVMWKPKASNNRLSTSTQNWPLYWPFDLFYFFLRNCARRALFSYVRLLIWLFILTKRSRLPIPLPSSDHSFAKGPWDHRRSFVSITLTTLVKVEHQGGEGGKTRILKIGFPINIVPENYIDLLQCWVLGYIIRAPEESGCNRSLGNGCCFTSLLWNGPVFIRMARGGVVLISLR